MTSKHDDKKPRKWRGEEVEDAAPGEAERAAERAEGKTPASAGTLERQRKEPLEVEPEDEERRRPSGETPDEKIAEASEAHRDDPGPSRRPPHGKL